MPSSGFVIDLQKEDQFFLGTHTCLGPWRLVTKLFGTHLTFFFEHIHGAPMNLA
jgi:hypothetical protein